MKNEKEKKQPKIHTRIRLEIDQKSQLQTLSEENGITMSALIRAVLGDYLNMYNYTQEFKK